MVVCCNSLHDTPLKMATKDPLTWREIKKEWLKFILEQHLSRNDAATSSSSSVEIKDFTTARNAAGQGFQSDLITIDIKADIAKNGGNPFPVDYSYKVKFLPEDVFMKEIIKTFNGHTKEHLMYSQVIKELNEFQAFLVDGQYRIDIPELIYGKCSEEVFVLVMENLKEKGYEMVEKFEGLDVSCVSLAIDRLSQLHAVSYVYIKERNLLKDNPMFKFDARLYLFVPFVSDFLIDTFVALLKSKGKTEAAIRLEEAKATLLQRGTITDEFHKETVAPKCLLHGDYWNNNIMFSYNNTEATSQKKPDSCKIIDWANSVIGNPLFDLCYLIYTSTTLETRKNHLHEFLKQYHNNFMRITTELGSVPSDWSFDDFQREWHKVYSNCLLLILVLVIFMQSKEYLKVMQRGSSAFDRPFLLPLRKFVIYIYSKMVKKIIPWMYSERSMKKMAPFVAKQWKGVLREILSGENESLTGRIFDLLCEADENGLFKQSPENSCS